MSPARPVQLAPSLCALAVTIMAALSPALGPLNALAQQTVNSPSPTGSGALDSSQIQAIIADQVMAWNVGDAKAFSKSFADDGSFTNIRGTVFYGHQAFEERHVEIFRTFFRGSKLAMSVTRLRFVKPDVAIVDIATELSNLQSAPPGVTRGPDDTIRTRLQEVFVKNRGVWWIASYHNVDVKAP